MCTQSEAILEKKMIEQLIGQGFDKVEIKDEAGLYANLKVQLEKHNKLQLSNKEFSRVLNYLAGGTIFDKSTKIRDKFELQLDSGNTHYLEFFNTSEWCKNNFQVANQITMIGKYKNRYDVTLLINGIPMVQIELKRRGIEMKEGFNQICRYHRHSFQGLFNYIQIFVISNGVNTAYFANNRQLAYNQTFCWTDDKNNKYSQLNEFTETFLRKCHLAKIIAKYIVLHQTNKYLMVLRPYQYYAVESIVKRVTEKVQHNGYIWHTTGSGKTLTSFKASQILTMNDDVDKVVFVVDRKDLDYQTMTEFNAFSKGSVDSTENTNKFIKQIIDDKTKLIITTIQKLNNAISKTSYQKRMLSASSKRIIFIFDECHRSQFGDTHSKIDKFFSNKTFFGFTGTPIFAENKVKNLTTKDLFDECLHKYVIKDAIDDGNVLGFSVEYYSTFKSKELIDADGDDLDVDDIQVKGINTKEVFDCEIRLEKIVDFIIVNHQKKSYGKEFNALFATSSIPTLLKYYEIFKRKKHNLKIATIFSYNANEDITDDGIFEVESYPEYPMVADPELEYNGRLVETATTHTREKLDIIVADYNRTFKTNYDLNKANGYNAYFSDITKKMKKKKIDILIVVNMLLTGFDSFLTNTIYVDKNLRYHGLVQAFSRTNRIYNEKKKYGNVVSFRNLKRRTDQAITLFSNPDALENVLMQSYEHYVEDFNHNVQVLLGLAGSVNDVDKLKGEESKAEFIQEFRALLRIMNLLTTFSEFSFADLDLTNQQFEDFRSKYLDLHELVKNQVIEKESILNDLDFELELIRRDNINVDYIINLLKDLEVDSASFSTDVDFILKSMDSSENLRDKKELIEKFIQENLPDIADNSKLEECLDKFIDEERRKEINALAETEQLDKDKLNRLIEEYEFSNHLHKDKVKDSLLVSYKFMEKKSKAEKIMQIIKNIVSKFRW